MKKLIPALIVLFFSLTLSAQYKKASIFGKLGRTYELGSQLYALGDGKGSPIGFKFGWGRDQDGKQLFRSGELQFIPSYTYSFSTTTLNNIPVKVTGKTKSTFIYAFNYAYYLLNNEEGSERKIMPFIGAGANLVLVSGIKSETITPEMYDLKMSSGYETINAGINGGVGCMVNFTPKVGLKLQAGYSYQHNFNEGDYGDDETKPYYLFTSHPYVSVGLRMRIVEN